MRSLRSIQTFSALRERDFRLVWVSTLLTAGSMQMETVVLAWYVLLLTDSPFLVGLLTSARLAATIFGAFSGTVADRVPRKGLILAVQVLMASAAFIMVPLILTGLVQVWHVFAAAAVTGMGRVFDQPARQALVADSVADDKVSNAISLNMTGMSIMWGVGPSLGGLIFESSGPAGAYVALGMTYVLSAGAMGLVRVKGARVYGGDESLWRTMVGGLGYVRRNGIIMAALIMAGIANLTAFPFVFTLMPVYAKAVLGTDSAGLGFLLSGIGIGSVLGSVIVASIPTLRDMGRYMVLAMVVWHVATVAVVSSGLYALSFGLLILSGIVQSMSMAFIASLLLGTSPQEYRGRVMGLRSLAVYPLPLGSMVSGALITALGVPATALINAVVGSVLILGTVLWIPSTWRPVPVPASSASPEPAEREPT